MIVVDASLMVDVLTDDGRLGELARNALAADPHWAAPEHLRVEVTSAVRGRLLAGKLSDDRAESAVRTLNRLTITYVSWREIADRVWELRHNVTPYDAAYLAVAETRGCGVATTDRTLRDCSWRRCPVDLVAIPA